MIICKKCKREISPWPLGHRSCSPKDWVKCISTDESRWVWKPEPGAMEGEIVLVSVGTLQTERARFKGMKVARLRRMARFAGVIPAKSEGPFSSWDNPTKPMLIELLAAKRIKLAQEGKAPWEKGVKV